MVEYGPIDLVTGESRSVRTARYLLFSAAVTALAFAPADPIWKWAGLAALGLAYSAVIVSLRRSSCIRSLRLLGDGMLTLGREGQPDIQACLGKDGWTTAWMTVIPFHPVDHRGQRRVLVCRSLNHPQDYRRLLCRMRLGSGSSPESGILGRE